MTSTQTTPPPTRMTGLCSCGAERCYSPKFLAQRLTASCPRRHRTPMSTHSGAKLSHVAQRDDERTLLEDRTPRRPPRRHKMRMRDRVSSWRSSSSSSSTNKFIVTFLCLASLSTFAASFTLNSPFYSIVRDGNSNSSRDAGGGGGSGGELDNFVDKNLIFDGFVENPLQTFVDIDDDNNKNNDEKRNNEFEDKGDDAANDDDDDDDDFRFGVESEIPLGELEQKRKIVKRQTGGGKPYKLASQEKLMLLQRHNYYRRLSAKDFLASASGMYKLSWSDDLAADATTSISCEFSGPRARPPRGRGRAFNAGKVGSEQEIIDIVSDWYDDGWRYTASSDTCFGNNRQACRDFITMMYEHTKQLGCAVIQCVDKSRQVYCVYSPGLPDLSNRPFTIGDACSTCPDADCDGGLCVSRKIVDNSVDERNRATPPTPPTPPRTTPRTPPRTTPRTTTRTTPKEEQRGGCSFERIRNKDLVGHHNKWKVGSVEECQGFCLSETDFKCKAFMYYEPYGSCALSAANHKDVAPQDYRDRKGLDYYYSTCGGKGDQREYPTPTRRTTTTTLRTRTTRDPYEDRRTQPTRNPYDDRRTRPTRNPYEDRRTVPTRKPYEDARTRPTRGPYEDRRSWPTRDPYEDRRTASTRPTRDPYEDRRTRPTRNPYEDRRTRPTRDPYEDRRTTPSTRSPYEDRRTLSTRSPYENRRTPPTRDPFQDRRTRPTRDPFVEIRTKPTPRPEASMNCRFDPIPEHSVDPTPSRKTDFLHWQDILTLEQCKEACKSGKPVGNCRAIAMSKGGVGCWLLPESSRDYQTRGELIPSREFDFHDLICDGRTPDAGAGTRPGVTDKPDGGSPPASADDYQRYADKTLDASEFPSQPASGLHWRSRFSLTQCLEECREDRVQDSNGCRAVAFDKRRGRGCWLLPQGYKYYRSKQALRQNPRFDFYDKKATNEVEKPTKPETDVDVEGYERRPNLGTYDGYGTLEPRMSLNECQLSCAEKAALGGRDCYAFQFNKGRGRGCYLFTEGQFLSSIFVRTEDYDSYEKDGGTPGVEESRCEFDRYPQKHIRKSAFPSRPTDGIHWRDSYSLDQCKRACEKQEDVPECRSIAFNSLVNRGCWLLDNSYDYYKTRNAIEPNYHYEIYDMKCDPEKPDGTDGTSPETGAKPSEEKEVDGCKYKLHEDHAIFPFPSLAKDAIHWQQGMDLETCKESCREGRPVSGCKSIVFYKRGSVQGCWLLTQAKSAYERRREYYEQNDCDFYELICEGKESPTKPGSCPSIPPGPGGSCAEECGVDVDCEDHLKCCSTGCGHVCVDPMSPDAEDDDEVCKFTEYKNQWIYRPEHGGNQTGLTLEQCKKACKMNTYFKDCRGLVFKNPPNKTTECYFMPNPSGFYGRLEKGDFIATYDMDCRREETAKGVLPTTVVPTTTKRFSAVSPKCSFTSHPRMAPNEFPSRMDEKVHWREGLSAEECKALCSHRNVVLNCRSIAISKDLSRPGCWLLPNSFVQMEKMDKLAPNIFYDMFDMKCKVEDCTFTVRRNRALAGYNSKRIMADSPNDCKQMCIEEDEFECLSFEWWKNSKDCSLSSDSIDTVPQTLFQHNENSDYYHRSCGFDPAPTQPLDICSSTIETLGINSGRVKDSQFSASSLEIPRKTAPHCARVINLNEECHGGYGWCPKVSDADPWLQLDLDGEKKVIGVMLYGGGDADRRVPRFGVRTSKDGREWKYFVDSYGKRTEFKGFTDSSIVGPVTITFPRHIHARHFRLYPLRGDDRQLENVCLRIELLTC